jgi:hypothetical protein
MIYNVTNVTAQRITGMTTPPIIAIDEQPKKVETCVGV